MEFESKIKSWVSLDTKIKKYNDALRELREEKKDIENEIHNYVNSNDMKDAIIKISDGTLKFNNLKVQQTLTFKYIQECLEDCISSKEDVDTIMKHIRNKRESKFVPEIKRYYDN